MPTLTLLSDDWLAWLDDNLHRGCSAASLVETMVKAGFARAQADQALTQALAKDPTKHHAEPARAAQAGAPQAYIYQEPRLPASGNVIHTHDRDVRIALRVAQPVIAVLDNFMSEEECDELVRLSLVKLKRSAIVDPQSGEEKVIDDRSSYGTFFLLNETDFIAKLDRRIAEVMHWPAENGEGIQILRYTVGGEYKAHFDYFAPDDPGSQVHLAKGGQRVSTMVMYLNDVAQGGETIFPALHLAVTPKKGSAVYFEYANDLDQIDPLTLHGGAPVQAGEKWIATKWMRQRRYG
jgi:prolyl 4-hydroxylase